MASFDLLLFSTNTSFLQQAVAAGVKGVIVDWERLGKPERQAGANTQISNDSFEDLQRVRAATSALVVCRLNPIGTHTPAEVEQAIGAGADELLLPMARSSAEVEEVLRLVNGRCALGMLVETLGALDALDALACLPLSRVYVGLNDLAIERDTTNIFTALADGTLERVRSFFHVPFGFGGLTVPHGGHPIACRLLIGELARLDCQFSFLRRSFHADVRQHDLATAIPAIHHALEAARQRSSAEQRYDQDALRAAVMAWPERIEVGP